jgi:hypothetical protein
VILSGQGGLLLEERSCGIAHVATKTYREEKSLYLKGWERSGAQAPDQLRCAGLMYDSFLMENGWD